MSICCFFNLLLHEAHTHTTTRVTGRSNRSGGLHHTAAGAAEEAEATGFPQPSREGRRRVPRGARQGRQSRAACGVRTGPARERRAAAEEGRRR